MTRFAQIATLPNIDAMEQGVDILSLDIYNPAIANRNAVFAYRNDKSTLDGRYVYPHQFRFTELNSTSFNADSYQIYNAYDLQQASAQQFSAGGGFEKIQFSTSASFQKVRQMTNSSQTVITEAHSIVELWRLTLEENVTLPLSLSFQSDVAALPSSYAANKSAYASFITQYGTHYAADAIFGGRSCQLSSMTAAQAAQLVLQSVDVSVEAGVALGINIGASSGTSSSSYQAFAKAVSQESVQWVGGIGSTDFYQWASSVETAPVVVLATLNPLYELLTAACFPGISDISRLQSSLQQAYADYMNGNGVSVGVVEAVSCVWVPNVSLTNPSPMNVILVSAYDGGGPVASGRANSHGVFNLVYFAAPSGGIFWPLRVASPGVSSTMSLGENLFLGATSSSETAPWLVAVMQAEVAGDPSLGQLASSILQPDTPDGPAYWQLVNPLSLEQSGKLLAGAGYLYQVMNPASGQYLKIGPGNFGDNSGLQLTSDAQDPMTYWKLQAIPWPT